MNYAYCPETHSAVDPAGAVYLRFPDDLPDWVAEEIVEQINAELAAMVDTEIRAMEPQVARFELCFPESEISEN